jgi:hypothetical protein
MLALTRLALPPKSLSNAEQPGIKKTTINVINRNLPAIASGMLTPKLNS